MLDWTETRKECSRVFYGRAIFRARHRALIAQGMTQAGIQSRRRKSTTKELENRPHATSLPNV